MHRSRFRAARQRLVEQSGLEQHAQAADQIAALDAGITHQEIRRVQILRRRDQARRGVLFDPPEPPMRPYRGHGSRRPPGISTDDPDARGRRRPGPRRGVVRDRRTFAADDPGRSSTPRPRLSCAGYEGSQRRFPAVSSPVSGARSVRPRHRSNRNRRRRPPDPVAWIVPRSTEEPGSPAEVVRSAVATRTATVVFWAYFILASRM